ncbi:hypothetical protein [Faecalispora jeddahensis]|jgi:hypothetical protein|uniref:hypothetical protein n=1 Tax=Faecalispora jeddahensis TaxID=1414721 RepID=UPI001A9B87B5|nr:hypothetical protein [Faecalispora jeddahensis]
MSAAISRGFPMPEFPLLSFRASLPVFPVPDLALAAPEGGHFLAFLRRLFLFTKRRLYHAFFHVVLFLIKKNRTPFGVVPTGSRLRGEAFDSPHTKNKTVLVNISKVRTICQHSMNKNKFL